MKRITLAVLALVLLAGVAGCVGGDDTGSSQATDTPVEVIKSNDGGEVHRFVEEGAISSGAGWKSGMSCVPIENTTLE